jgi:hypothetical protein
VRGATRPQRKPTAESTLFTKKNVRTTPATVVRASSLERHASLTVASGLSADETPSVPSHARGSGVYPAQAVRVDKIELLEESKSFHVHFGAGRLGLGLVLPALQGSKVPFAILQRPSREWSELGNAEWQDSIAVNINGALRDRAIPLLDQTHGGGTVSRFAYWAVLTAVTCTATHGHPLFGEPIRFPSAVTGADQQEQRSAAAGPE